MSNVLHDETLSLVKEERRLTGLIIEKLQQNNDQKLFLKMGYSSLFEYCTRALGYSESCAYRRISAVRLAKEVPEIKEKLNAGTLNLTNLSMAQSFFSRTKPSLETKREVLQKIENSTKRQAEELLVRLGDKKPRQKESLRPASENSSYLRVELSKKTLEKLERLKSLRSHKNPSMDFSELIDDMATYMLKKLDHASKNSATFDTGSHEVGGRNPRYVPAAIKKAIWRRDQGRCSYQDPITQRRCSSRHLLQMDHILPLRLRGETSVNNLRLLCHAHHQLRDRED